MQAVAETVFHQRPIETFGPLGLLGPGKPVEHRHSLAPARVRLPPLATGRHFLERWQVRELPEPGACIMYWCIPRPVSLRWAIR